MITARVIVGRTRMTTHLKTLITRVVREEYLQRKDAEKKSKPIEVEPIRNRVINLVEYLKYFPESIEAPEEKAVAEKMISQWDLSDLLEVPIPELADAIEARIDSVGAFCVRCGRLLSNERSVKYGMGIVCRGKAKEGDWDLGVDEKTETDIRREAIFYNDFHPSGARLGLRRLAKDYEVSISTIRFDREVNLMNTEVDREVRSLLKEAIKHLDTERHDPPVSNFNPDITCPIYRRKGDGTHCKKQCRRSKE